MVDTAPALAGGCEQYRPLLSKYNWNVEVMLRVMDAESGCTSAAVGDRSISFWSVERNRLEGVSCGLVQVRVLAGRPDCETLKDPATNIDWAYKIYTGQGYNAWSVCTNGKANCY